MLPKGIIFDLDDTIIAYTPVVDPTWRRICDEYTRKTAVLDADTLFNKIRKISSWYWSDKERHLIGRRDLNSTRRKILERVFQELDIDDSSLAWEIADAFSEQREEETYLFPGAEKTLEHLSSHNISLSIITNGEAEKQRSKIKKFRLKRFFKSILIEGELGFGKPEETVYIRALKELGLDPEEVWMVGDNLEWDVSAPQKMGIFGVWNDFTRKGLPPSSEIIPDRIIHSIAELIE